MKKTTILATVATLALMSISSAAVAEAPSSPAASGLATGGSDGLITAGRGKVNVWGSSTTLSRSDTKPAYSTNVSNSRQMLNMGSSGRNLASGDFIMDSSAESRAQLKLGTAEQRVVASTTGLGLYTASTTGRHSSVAGSAAGTTETKSLALDLPGTRFDVEAGSAQMTIVSNAHGHAADRNAASVRTIARTVTEASMNH